MKVGIAGIGGIGSNVARHLAQAGLSHLRVVDYDRMEVSNLNRQFYSIDQAGQLKTLSLKQNLLKIFPAMVIEAVDCRMESGDAAKLFFGCDIVVEGFDDKAAKKMLIEELAGAGKQVVAASGIAGEDMEGVGVKKLGNCHIVGDFVSDMDEVALFPPKIGLVVALMAGIVLKLVKESENE
ncbi:MAG: sulfur carrier protein ThiS adenylyltransferase ThiF [Desulfobacteraceae bacterium]|nr:sulfur carrier protein ThiS adenylyltransferase ThiF [Desulfobacteraceae bacterium]